MKIIGITGGIGSGKSTVSTYLKKKGYNIIDADKVAGSMTEPGSPILHDLAACFGSHILEDNGVLNRKALASEAFSSDGQKEKLDDIMLKGIIKRILNKTYAYENIGETVLFIDAPLLFESGLHERCNEVWVVDAQDDVRIQRVAERDGVTKDHVLARMSKQMSSEEKRSRADFVLDNSTVQDDLYAQIEKILR